MLLSRPLVFAAMLLAVPAAQADAVSPGQRFPSPLLDVRAPNEDGWEKAGDTQMALVFKKNGTSSGESYIAQAMLFPVPYPQTTDQFIAFIQEAVNSDIKTGRMTVLESKYEYTEQRGYPCVRFTGLTVSADTSAGVFNRQPVRVQVRSMYCQHPTNKRLGFLAGFTHRGSGTDAALGAKADAFAAGIQVPAAAKN